MTGICCGSHHNSMHDFLIFKEQAKVKDEGWREKGLVKPHYSIQHIEGYGLLCCKDKKKIFIPQSLRQTTKSTLLAPWVLTTFRTGKNSRHYQEHHDMTWYYTRCWTFIVYVPVTMYVKDKEGAYAQEIWAALNQNSRRW
jgi:hypothetical protein